MAYVPDGPVAAPVPPCLCSILGTDGSCLAGAFWAPPLGSFASLMKPTMRTTSPPMNNRLAKAPPIMTAPNPSVGSAVRPDPWLLEKERTLSNQNSHSARPTRMLAAMHPTPDNNQCLAFMGRSPVAELRTRASALWRSRIHHTPCSQRFESPWRRPAIPW